METFKGISPHRPLNDSGKDIRIIKLLPNHRNAPIACELEHIALEPGADYEALSYCWGDASVTKSILLDSKPYPITLNLLDGLRYLRHEQHPRRLWVDSLCINQMDVAERNREILRMRDIYRLASAVVIWLGDYRPFTRQHVERIFDYVSRFAECNTREKEDELIRDTGFDELWHMQSQLHDFIRTRKWFQRMWILQEVSVRPKPRVKDVSLSPNLICGDLPLPFAYLRVVDEYWVTNTFDKRICLPPICPQMDRMKVIWYGHQAIALKEQKATVTQLLAWILALVAARFHSTDQRDIVYATLGLLNADPLPVELIPDYGKSPTEILIECASFIITQSRILTILQYNSMHTPELPSWVPDWQHDSCCPIILQAKAHSTTHVKIHKDIGALEVDIIPLAEICRVGPQLEHRVPSEGLISTWSNFFMDAEECLAKGQPAVSGYSSFGKALWQLLLVFDLSRQDLHEPGWHLAAAEHVPPLFFREKSLLGDSRPGWVQDISYMEEILAALEATIPRKKLFRCSDDSIGLTCQPNIEPNEGDFVCAIKGSYGEYLLRQFSDGLKIIGRCERSKRGKVAIGDKGLHWWAECTDMYEFYEALWTINEGYRVLIY
ncbi:heterokaryon incompatibility protein-domain-containing protein [Astrocystis sublimbata]|nr:heterokaryon incompatibility protein-domain-containing protein [Astrocystis sublimbata]